MTQTMETDLKREPAAFSWYELHTPDAAAAAAFYEPVLRWTAHDSGMPNQKYTLVSAGEMPVGGLLEKPASSGEKARWIGYIGVGDVQAYSDKVQQAGGVIHRPAEEIPGVGKFAVVADPQGAVFVLFQPLAGVTPPGQPDAGTPGMPAWHDLGALDQESAFSFYANLFGWTKSDAIPMGPNAVYQMFAVGSQPAGGMMTVSNPGQGAAWMFYFYVDEIDAAIARVKENGGTLLHGPMVVPGGQQTAHCLDPQGAAFGMVTPRGQ